MTIWMVAILILGLLAVGGYFLGAIRTGVALLGLLVGLALAFPLASTVQPLIPLVGLAHPVWSWVLPPVLALLLVGLVFFGLSFLAHLPVARYYRYKTDEYHRLAWEHLNRHLGLCLGLIMGLIYMIVLGLLVYVPGYLTVQMASDDKDPAMLRLVNRLRTDLQATGLDKFVARFDPAPAQYYEVADLLGFLYHNQLLHSRLGSYPPLFALRERQELQDIATDKEFAEQLLGQQPSLIELAKHTRIMAIVNNPDLAQELLRLDFNDLRTYLEKGQSPIFDPIKILGRWALDVNQVIIQAKRANPDISAREMQALKSSLTRTLSGVTLIATSDKKAVIQGIVGDLAQLPRAMATPLRSGLAAPPRTAPPAAAAGAAPAPRRGPVSTSGRSIVDTAFRSRLGNAPGQTVSGGGPVFPGRPGGPGGYNRPLGPPGAPAVDPNAPVAPPPPPKIETKTLQGTWDGEGTKYWIKLPGPQGKEEEAEVAIEEDELTLSVFGQRLIFTRQG